MKKLICLLLMVMVLATTAHAGSWCIEFREEFSGATAAVNVFNAQEHQVECIARSITELVENADVGSWEVLGWPCENREDRPVVGTVNDPTDHGCD